MFKNDKHRFRDALLSSLQEQTDHREELVFGLVVNEFVEQQHAALRWSKIRFLMLIGFVAMGYMIYWGIMYYLFAPSSEKAEDYIGVVRIEGMIAAGQPAAARSINPALARAFRDSDSKAVAVIINSPGGTPVQASLIHERITQLREQYPDKEFIVIGEDMMTSGGYLVATSADQILVNRSTVTGSIGVIAESFGFDRLIKRFGIERRAYTSGSKKNRLDSFLPAETDDEKKIGDTLAQMHRHFVDAVLKTRRDKLKAPQDELFNGDFWTGEEAVTLGLADGLGSLRTVMQQHQVEKLIDYTPQPSMLEKTLDYLGVMFSVNMSKPATSFVANF